MLTLRAHNTMIFGGMNGKLASKNFFCKKVPCTEGENDEMCIPNTHERSRLNKEKLGNIKIKLSSARNLIKI